MVSWTPDHMKVFVPSFEPSVHFHIENWRKQIPHGAPKNVVEALRSTKNKGMSEETINAIADAFTSGQKLDRYLIVRRNDEGGYDKLWILTPPKI